MCVSGAWREEWRGRVGWEWLWLLIVNWTCLISRNLECRPDILRSYTRGRSAHSSSDVDSWWSYLPVTGLYVLCVLLVTCQHVWYDKWLSRLSVNCLLFRRLCRWCFCSLGVPFTYKMAGGPRVFCATVIDSEGDRGLLRIQDGWEAMPVWCTGFSYSEP